MSGATIVHTNTDFPAGWRLDTSSKRLAYRATDHDAAVIILGRAPATPTPLPAPIAPAPAATPTATAVPATLAATVAPTPAPTATVATPAAVSTAPSAPGNGRVWALGLAAAALVVAGGLLARRLTHR